MLLDVAFFICVRLFIGLVYLLAVPSFLVRNFRRLWKKNPKNNYR